MESKTMSLSPLVVLLATLVVNPGDPIVIDGRFADWNNQPVAVADPLDAPGAVIDITTVRLAHDDAFVYLFADLTNEVCIQQLDGMLHLVFDADGNAETGRELHGMPGADIVVTMSPVSRSHGQQRNMGVGLISLTYAHNPEDPESRPLSPYDAGFTFGPTFASAQFEFRLRRGAAIPETPTLFTGDTLHVKLVATDVAGKVLDDTEVMSLPLTIAPSPAEVPPRTQAGSVDPLAKNDPNHLRVVSFNAQYAKIFNDAERLGRVLRALKPDVLLFQEFTDKTLASDVESALNRHAPPAEGRWHVRIGEGGGNLRCAVSSSLPTALVEALRVVSFPNQPERHLRQESAIIEHQGRRLLVVSIHLRCCGGATGPEEESRMTEVQQLRKAIDPLVGELQLDGIVIAGDFNLVGTRNPLDTLCRIGDLDGSDLTFAQPYRLDGRTNGTWADRTQPFVPGRLDYIVISDASLRSSKEFVFDSADLPASWRQHHGLETDDAQLLSDHYPVVIDLAWIRERSAAKQEVPADDVQSGTSLTQP